MSGYLWRATVRNVNRALREINAFEWEGDYRAEARNRLKELLEERMDEELEQYLGRAKHERRGKETRRIIVMERLAGTRPSICITPSSRPWPPIKTPR